MGTVTNINEVLDGHSVLQLDCVDRLYLNAYVPNLQVSGQVHSFFSRHRGQKIVSPALMAQIGNRFVREVKAFAAANDVPLLRLGKPDRSRWGDRKVDHVRPYMERAERDGRYGVVAIVVSQEFQWVFGGRNRAEKPGAVIYRFEKAERRVGVYYFYVLDREFGPGFIKICTYFPYPAKVWLNGHEWAKRQASRVGIAFTPLSNGFASCAEPEHLQQLCDRLGPADVQAFFDRWMGVIPTPLTPADRAAGYWWELSMRQVEVSRTVVLDDPRRARRFFEALVADNVDVGRPEQVTVVFARQLRRQARGRPLFRSRIVTAGSQVKIDFAYKHSRIKQYLKDGRAVRVETVVNSPDDLSVPRRLQHLPELVAKARAVNRRLLMIERAGQDCAIGTALFERIHQPYAREGKRTGAFRFGDPRVTALAGAGATTLNAVTGFSNKSLRGHVAGLLGREYTRSQMNYDLRRLRLHGLIQRIPHRNLYTLTPDGIRVAVFYIKLQNRLLSPLLEADQPPAPAAVRRALATLEHAVNDHVTAARLQPAAA
jgi:hypothetical protein